MRNDLRIDRTKGIIGILLVGGVLMTVIAMNVAGGGENAQASSCFVGDTWSFESVQCTSFEANGSRLELASVAERSTARVAADQAVAAALKLNPGAKVLEVQLVRAWSVGFAVSRQLLWAVSLELPAGVRMGGGGILAEERAKLRSPGDSRPLSEEDERLLQENVTARMNAAQSSQAASYHLDFFDPNTGQWLGGAEGATSRGN